MPHSIKSKGTLASCLLLSLGMFLSGCSTLLGVKPRTASPDQHIRDLTFKCQLMPVEFAISEGLYKAKTQEVNTPENRSRLIELFPDGVCDYSKPGQGELSAEELQLKKKR